MWEAGESGRFLQVEEVLVNLRQLYTNLTNLEAVVLFAIIWVRTLTQRLNTASKPTGWQP